MADVLPCPHCGSTNAVDGKVQHIAEPEWQLVWWDNSNWNVAVRTTEQDADERALEVLRLYPHVRKVTISQVKTIWA